MKIRGIFILTFIIKIIIYMLLYKNCSMDHFSLYFTIIEIVFLISMLCILINLINISYDESNKIENSLISLFLLILYVCTFICVKIYKFSKKLDITI